MEATLKKIMSDVFGLNPDDINESTTMDNVEIWDSLKHMELIVSIEQNFDIPQLTMDEIVSMISYVKILEVLNSKKN